MYKKHCGSRAKRYAIKSAKVVHHKIMFFKQKHLIDYEYNWNFASIRFWTITSRLIFLSLDPIQFNFNLTNDYLLYGKWAVNSRIMLSNRRRLMELNHTYHYATFVSNLLFDLHLINSHYNLDVNYSNLNYSIN